MSDDNLRLEIGHVLFIDIVGYSKPLSEEQKEWPHQPHSDRPDGRSSRFYFPFSAFSVSAFFNIWCPLDPKPGMGRKS